MLMFNTGRGFGTMRWVIGIVLLGVMSLVFLGTHSTSGTFHADEVGVVLGSLSRNREFMATFNEAAYTAQPPLDFIIREKIFRPMGDLLGISKTYPELFHRLLPLLWWILPIGLFVIGFDKYSVKNRFIVLTAILFISSSKFLGYYLAEARHYSAIAAVFAAMFIIWMQDAVSWDEKKYRFLIVSAALPFLHMVTFSYWLTAVTAFFINLFRTALPKDKKRNLGLLGSYVILVVLIVLMYLKIKAVSVDWQHPAASNLNLKYISTYIKWTVDWTLYGTPFYWLWTAIPGIIKNNLLPVFSLSGIGVGVFAVKKYFLKTKTEINILVVWLMTVLVVWPVTVLTFLYESGMFTGERYSIAILVVILFLLSYSLWAVIRKFVSNDQKRLWVGWGLLCVLTIWSIAGAIPTFGWKLSSDENEFVKNNEKLLRDKDAILIADNGGFSSAIPMLANLDNTPFNVQFFQCRIGTFWEAGQNTLKVWLEDNKKDKVYLLGSRQDFMAPNEIVWNRGDLALYRLTSVDESGLCQNMQTFDECYLKCFRGKYPAAPDDRSIPGTAPHLDIHRP